jgi:hypothetical protein
MMRLGQTILIPTRQVQSNTLIMKC